MPLVLVSDIYMKDLATEDKLREVLTNLSKVKDPIG